jgi:hypothetical protein
MKLFAVTSLGAFTVMTMTSPGEFGATVPPPDDEAVADFAAWLETATGVEDWSKLTHLACVVEEERTAICYGLTPGGRAVGFWSPRGDDGWADFDYSENRPIANEDRPPPSDDLTAVEYTSMWDRNPDLDSVQFNARDDEAPSTLANNYFIQWDPEPADSGDGWVRIQGFAEAVGCDIPIEPPVLATDIDC